MMAAGRPFTRRGWASYAAPVPTEGDEQKEWLIAIRAQSKSLGSGETPPSPRGEVRPAATRRDGGRGYNHELTPQMSARFVAVGRRVSHVHLCFDDVVCVGSHSVFRFTAVFLVVRSN